MYDVCCTDCTADRHYWLCIALDCFDWLKLSSRVERQDKCIHFPLGLWVAYSIIIYFVACHVYLFIVLCGRLWSAYLSTNRRGRAWELALVVATESFSSLRRSWCSLVKVGLCSFGFRARLFVIKVYCNLQTKKISTMLRLSVVVRKDIFLAIFFSIYYLFIFRT